MANKDDKIEEIARRRGFFWQSSEIYGGLSGFYDYGHLGAIMKRKWENAWRSYFIGMNDSFFEIETPNIAHEKVFIASGHVSSFVDPIVKCKKCGNMERADQLIEIVLKESFEGASPKELDKIIKERDIKCSKCGGALEEVGVLNMLFPVTVGSENPQKAYLRGETAQSAYVNFKREFDSLRKQLPFGLAIVGKAFRNEISPRQLLIRLREFTQAELQIFFDPRRIDEHPDFNSVKDYKLRIFSVSERENNKIVETTCEELVKRLPKFYVYHMAKVQQFYLDVVKIPAEIFRFRELADDEKAFYNRYHWDMEIYFAHLERFVEVGGVHYRTDHDLSGHEKVSKQDMSVFFDGRKFIPHVLELSFGVDRNVYALLEIFYDEEKERSIFRFPGRFAPYDCAVFPLVNKDDIPERAKEIKAQLSANIFYDGSGSIGRRYRRMDEIGVPACVTIDHETLDEGTVTMRDRDSMKQVRVKVKDLQHALERFLDGEKIENLGKLVEKQEES